MQSTLCHFFGYFSGLSLLYCHFLLLWPICTCISALGCQLIRYFAQDVSLLGHFKVSPQERMFKLYGANAAEYIITCSMAFLIWTFLQSPHVTWSFAAARGTLFQIFMGSIQSGAPVENDWQNVNVNIRPLMAMVHSSIVYANFCRMWSVCRQCAQINRLIVSRIYSHAWSSWCPQELHLHTSMDYLIMPVYIGHYILFLSRILNTLWYPPVTWNVLEHGLTVLLESTSSWMGSNRVLKVTFFQLFLNIIFSYVQSYIHCCIIWFMHASCLCYMYVINIVTPQMKIMLLLIPQWYLCMNGIWKYALRHKHKFLGVSSHCELCLSMHNNCSIIRPYGKKEEVSSSPQ